MIVGLRDPSDIRFLDGLRGGSESIFFSSAAIEEQIDETPVLVADSVEPSRRQFPLISRFHFLFPDIELPELRPNESVPDDE